MGSFLGLDSSTQSLSAMLIDADSGKVLVDESLSFGKSLPQFEWPNGFLEHNEPRVKHADPLMWVAALDRLLGQLRARGVDFAAVAGISGAGQQHASVYLNRRLSSISGWDPAQDLASQVKPLLSRSTSPIWMD